ncbi:putative lipoprotein [Aliivibrio wodanis]|uniref:Putative lipoprotein n=1 Tax=Aliivibrio wodanis TaxID=80852 RepID=A0A090IKZ9_9GAMM|nr:putative lipoprotein [Aliivibrio wodanis]
MNIKNSKLSASLAFILGISLTSGCTSTLLETTTDQTSPILETNIEESLIIPVIIGNKTYSFLVDTGASVTVIDSNIASEITETTEFSNLALHYQKDLESIRTVSGSMNGTDITFLKPVPMSIGSQTIRDHEVWLSLDMELLSQAIGIDIDGIIGIDTFRQMNWLVNNSTKRLTLLNDSPLTTQFDQCIGYSDSYNHSPILYLAYSDYDISVLVDTGASHSYFGQEFIDYLNQNTQSVATIPQAALAIEANGLTYTDTYVLSDLTFNNMPLGDLEIGGTPQEKFAVGMNFFSRFQQYAFIPSKMMFCYNADTIQKEWTKPNRTIRTRYINEELEIFYNPETIIADYGLRNGDIILKVNNNVYKPIQIDKLNDVLSYTEKGNLSVTIRRNGEVIIINI